MNVPLNEIEVLPPARREEHGTAPVSEGNGVFRVMGTLVVMVVLGGVAAWGHFTEWNFVPQHRVEDGSALSRAGLTVLRRVSFGPGETRTLGTGSERLWLEFASAEAVENAGIEAAPTWQTEMSEAVSANGEALFDPELVARLSSRAAGTAAWVAKTVGDKVRAGEVLALIDAAEVGKTKAEYQQALVQLRLKRQGLANLGPTGSAVPQRQRREAEAAAQDALARLLGSEQALANLGLPVRSAEYEQLSLEEIVGKMRLLGVTDAVGGLQGKGLSANLVPVRATMDGELLSVNVVAGETVEANQVLFVVVDPRRLLLTLHFNAATATRLAPKQVVAFRPDGLRDEYEGQITSIGTSADEATRMIPVRVQLANAAGQLRASMLGTGRVVLRTDPKALVVPREAVQSLRGQSVVFVRNPDFFEANGSKSFEARVVRTGATDTQNTEIVAGLGGGETVAAKGSEVLRDELERQVGH